MYIVYIIFYIYNLLNFKSKQLLTKIIFILIINFQTYSYYIFLLNECIHYN